MTPDGENSKRPQIRRYRWEAAISLIILLAAGFAVYGHFYYRSRIGIEQPVPFSHHVHVYMKKISCYMCHSEAMDTARAGIPPLQTCMLCHSRIAVTYPPVKKVRDHYFESKPIIWEKVYSVPDFVYFDHSMHIRRSIDCSACHGNVPMMDRIIQVQEMTMGFCIDCHKKNNATHDCFTCHR